MKSPSPRKKLKLLNSARTHIALGLSGGVDSATSAALLLSEGYRVTGVTCVFHDDEASLAAVAAAEDVCRFLGIDHVVYEAQQAFDEVVVQPFINDCCAGLTPSPCVTCNRFCKIPVLCQAADDLGCEKIATGHYARVVEDLDTGRLTLKRALDETKDQTYMLSLLTQEQLSRLVLPLGGFTKAEVRHYAEEQGIPVAHRPESQDLCFIAGDYRDFLLDVGVQDDPGPIRTLDGVEVGTHEGLHRYTLGQRKGLGVALGEPQFVVDKDVEDNAVIIAPKERAFISAFEVGDLNWMLAMPKADETCTVKIRYRSAPVVARVEPLVDGRVRAVFNEPQSLTAPGQCCAFYQSNVLLGGGIIDKVVFSA
ncbi:tRNA 2-thiouridine(34) synthase MnmA [Anaerotardibacter muris]|uniref:tRNA 2-thiouridine(34) synthase MnmA n=1 Tax=Anaerotardibacter muris TaxID=2941505 RepID=UPI0023B90533|nr:tRNA 2-thiouridine(34) synthase MnmA [Anaerotardibacter muris]